MTTRSARHALACAIVLVLAAASRAHAQQPDTILINGQILTVDSDSSIRQALAIRDGRIAALGTSADIRRTAGPRTRIVDLEGRTVIPGLIDSHMHAIRAGQSFATEVNWIGARSLPEALARIRSTAARLAPGAWLIVAGGWTERQFAENRPPTQAELIAAAPDNPVYVQLGYRWAVMTPRALTALQIAADTDLPAGITLQRDASGGLTGAVAGSQPGIVSLFDRLPRPTYQQKVDGTKQFFRELNRLGLTGVVDPGGNNLLPADYAVLFDVWRAREMTVRVAYSLGVQSPGHELEDYKEWTLLLPMSFGDDLLHFNGIGERVTTGMYNVDDPAEAERERFYEIATWAAERGLGVTVHWGRDASVDALLTVFERVNRRTAIAPLRWSIAHLDDASIGTLERMKALGVGWAMQDAMYFGGEQFLQQRGAAAGMRTPPLETARRLGVTVGAGTDAHRVASYNPFTALQWLIDGKTIAGAAMRGPAETPGRLDALRMYTKGSAWFSHDDDTRGSLEVGKLADLAVLTRDYLAVPADQIGSIESVLTMVGGRVVYASLPYAQLEP